ncbi:MAG: spore coat protein U domain-containing protein [Candidatus Binataceae bacterium]
MRAFKLLAIAGLFAMLVPALAMAQPTTTIPVQAEVTSGCVMTGSTFDFGQINPLTITGTEKTAQNIALVVTCSATPSIALSIAIDTGANGALPTSYALPGTRALFNGTSALGYDVYQPAATSLGSVSNGPVLWGNTTCATPGMTLWGTGANAWSASGLAIIPNENVFEICGVIPAQVSPLTAGVYTDLLTVTMNF